MVDRRRAELDAEAKVDAAWTELTTKLRIDSGTASELMLLGWIRVRVVMCARRPGWSALLEASRPRDPTKGRMDEHVVIRSVRSRSALGGTLEGLSSLLVERAESVGMQIFFQPAQRIDLRLGPRRW